MNHFRRFALIGVATLAVLVSMACVVSAQDRAVVLTGADLTSCASRFLFPGADGAYSDA